MIFNIRGPSGSGKTHLVYRLLRDYSNEPLWEPSFGTKGPARTPRAYRLGNLYVLGRYTGAVCGGVDGWFPLAVKVEPLIRYWAEHGHVLVESLVLSSAVTLWRQVKQEADVTLLFLDTPVDLCIERIYQRNGGKPIKEKLVRQHHGTIHRQEVRLAAEGFQVRPLDHRTAYEQLVEELRHGGWDGR